MKYSGWTFARFALAFPFLTFGFLACSSNDDGGAGTGPDAAVTESTINDYCKADCTWECHCATGSLPSGCPSTDAPDPACVTKCVSENRARAARIRDVWLRFQASCIAEHLAPGANRCGSIVSDCSRRFIEADPAYPNIPVVQKCHGLAAKLTDNDSNPPVNCADGPHVTPECNALATLTESGRQAADAACLGGDKTCATLEECLEDAQGE